MATFKDNFSEQAEIYAQYRPHYPVALFQFLSSLTKEHRIAWDCGTGNGQAAVGLAEFYQSVIATDPSAQQIDHCFPNPKITYRVEKAEDFSHSRNSIDLITVANALHWFDFDQFYKVVEKVLKKDGAFAAWAYGIPKVSEDIDQIVRTFHDDTLGELWTKENKLVEKEYQTIPFPFEEIKCPDFVSHREFNLPEFIAYLNTWSANQKFIKKYHFNPADILIKHLQPLWGENSAKKNISWKIILKAGRITGS